MIKRLIIIKYQCFHQFFIPLREGERGRERDREGEIVQIKQIDNENFCFGPL